jgi:hypothetical protein
MSVRGSCDSRATRNVGRVGGAHGLPSPMAARQVVPSADEHTTLLGSDDVEKMSGVGQSIPGIGAA